jgi:hypothetical protein
MSAYPAYRQLRDSTATVAGGHTTARATNGALRVQRLFDTDKADFEVHHVLSPAQWAELVAFYNANRDLDVTFRWAGDGQTYTVRFTAPPQPTRRLNHIEARVRLAQV